MTSSGHQIYDAKIFFLVYPYLSLPYLVNSDVVVISIDVVDAIVVVVVDGIVVVVGFTKLTVPLVTDLIQSP